ncbi:hypothetical protein LX64_01021 [Chitinophaga skermanii]|uniref:S-adenosyl-l-methionine hydroxide adenosyltransferase n=1 Tax=Chitinophaga skermanii TaxID=331697 RepID=A0A327QVL5_9BACT|nr:SAM-dependent chlorinase/fluorinase [Chitinophaga skermanii]RAJ08371.1 hypothetical protein LX64_01021 [Chitinophaga skermanii]
MAIITLTSDIGLQDYLAGAIKGQLLQCCPEAKIIDVSHQISPYNLPQAAYVCKSAFEHFPAGTFHLVLINLFDRKPDHMLLAQYNDQYVVCADNGFITMINGEMPTQIVKIKLDTTKPRNSINIITQMAKAIQEMIEGKSMFEVGEKITGIVEKRNLQPLTGEDYIEGQILHIDNFENVVVNITQEQFEQHRGQREFKIYFRRDEVINQISETYPDVPEGHKLALFNAAGYLEIAVNKGNAAGLFGLQGFRKDQLVQPNPYTQLSFYQTVRIIFE